LNIWLTLASIAATLLGVFVGYRLALRREMGTVEWLQEFRSWAAEVIRIMARAEYATAQAELSSTDLAQWRTELSALADQGRFFVPSVKRAAYGQHKIGEKIRSGTTDPAQMGAEKRTLDQRRSSLSAVKILPLLFFRHAISGKKEEWNR